MLTKSHNCTELQHEKSSEENVSENFESVASSTYNWQLLFSNN